MLSRSKTRRCRSDLQYPVFLPFRRVSALERMNRTACARMSISEPRSMSPALSSQGVTTGTSEKRTFRHCVGRGCAGEGRTASLVFFLTSPIFKRGTRHFREFGLRCPTARGVYQNLKFALNCFVEQNLAQNSDNLMYNEIIVSPLMLSPARLPTSSIPPRPPSLRNARNPPPFLPPKPIASFSRASHLHNEQSTQLFSANV